MADEPIRYRHRYTGRIEVEAIYGERWLRWAYGNGLGRFSLWALAARPCFARWYGWRMSQPSSRTRIPEFIQQFGIDPSEFAQPADSFASFNEFFARRLRPGARAVNPDPRAVVFPADGRHMGFANLEAADAFFIKGQKFRLREFLANDDWFRRFAGGAAVFSRLCPVDYHRIHFPVAGTPQAPRLVNGWLWSVNPIALRRNLDYLWRNKRWHCEIDAGPLGRVLMTEIGATNVGSVTFSYQPGAPVPKGHEKGAFHFGGSAVMTLFEPGRVTLSEDLLEASSQQLELYAHVGDVMGIAAVPTEQAG